MIPQEEYIKLWKQAIHLCETEPNINEAVSFVHSYYNHNEKFTCLDEKTLFMVFIGLVVYEERFCLQYGSTSPATWCFHEILSRMNNGKYDKELTYDIGDWAARYAKNPYIPMGTCRGFGPRAYIKFEQERKLREFEHLRRMRKQQDAKEKRTKKHILEAQNKIKVAKKRQQERLAILQDLRNKTIPEALKYIAESRKSIFYFIEIIKEWFASQRLTNDQKESILQLFPNKSTKHNIKIKKQLLELYLNKKHQADIDNYMMVT